MRYFQLLDLIRNDMQFCFGKGSYSMNCIIYDFIFRQLCDIRFAKIFVKLNAKVVCCEIIRLMYKFRLPKIIYVLYEGVADDIHVHVCLYKQSCPIPIL